MKLLGCIVSFFVSTDAIYGTSTPEMKMRSVHFVIPLYVLPYAEINHFIFHRPGIFHTRLPRRGEDRTPDKCLICEFIAYLERCLAARHSQATGYFPLPRYETVGVL